MSVSSQAPQQPEQSPAVLAIAQAIEQLTETQFSGSLSCDAAHVVRLQLFFVAGRLVWAGGGMHRLRRWRRLLKQICPEAIFALAQLTPAVFTPTWEYEALRGLLKQAHISRAQARTLIAQQISEVLFDIVQSWSLAESHEVQVDDKFKIKDAITLIPAQDLLPQVFEQWQVWSDAGMRLYSPNLSPLLDDPIRLQTQVSAGTFAKLQQMLRGQHSLRELASLIGQEVGKLSQALFVYEQQGLLQMRTTPDMSGSIPTPSAHGSDWAALKTLSLSGLVNSSSLTQPSLSSRSSPTQGQPDGAASNKALNEPVAGAAATDRAALAHPTPSGPSGDRPSGAEPSDANRSDSLSPQNNPSGSRSPRNDASDRASSRSELFGNDLSGNDSPRSRSSSGGLSANAPASNDSSGSYSLDSDSPDGYSSDSHSSDGNPSSNAPLIICIDDHELVRERIGLVLTQQGYRFRGIANPVEALSTVIELRPSLVFVDLVMPSMSGYDVCGQIRRVGSLQDVPLIILTGNDTILDRMRGKLAGATAYLTKPISPEEILAVVSRQLAAKAG